MPAQTMESAEIVFLKTEKGREEVAKRSYGLTPVQRRVLILIDGSRNLDALAGMIPAMVPSGQLGEILSHLLDQDLILASESDPKAQTPAGKPAALAPAAGSSPPAADGPVLTDNPATLRLAKDFMTTTAQTYLGLLSAPLIQRIEQARSAAQLMSVAGQWNMALRDSAQGRRFADPFLEQVRSALTADARPALEMGA